MNVKNLSVSLLVCVSFVSTGANAQTSASETPLAVSSGLIALDAEPLASTTVACNTHIKGVSALSSDEEIHAETDGSFNTGTFENGVGDAVFFGAFVNVLGAPVALSIAPVLSSTLVAADRAASAELASEDEAGDC